MRPGLAATLFLALAGCLGEGAGGGLGFAGQKPDSSVGRRAPLASASLAGGKVVVAAPRGYCIDRNTLKSGPSGGFALIGSCAVLGTSGPDVEPVVMTVQAQPRLLRQEAPDAAALATAAAPAKVLERADGDGISMIHLAEGGDRVLGAGDGRYWRGAMLINGYLVGLALYAPKDSPAAGTRGKAYMLALAEALREASPIRDYAEEAAAAQAARAAREAQGEAASPDGPPRETGGLRRLFPNLFQ